MAYWIAIGPPGNREIALEKGVWGFPLRNEKTWKLVSPNDTLLFYATAPVKGVVGYGIVRRAVVGESPLWPEEVKEGRVLWPLRIEFELKGKLPRDRWESQGVRIDRGGLVFQRAFQPLAGERAQDLIRGLQSASTESSA